MNSRYPSDREALDDDSVRPVGGAADDRNPRVVVVAQGPPALGGISSFATTIVDDPVLAGRFEMVLLNTTRRSERKAGSLSLENTVHAITDAVRTFRAARHASIVHVQTALMPTLPLLRALALCAAARAGGAAVLCHVHSGRVNSGRSEAFSPGRVTRWLLSLLRIVDMVLTVSDRGTETLGHLVPGTDVETIDNAVDVSLFDPVDPGGNPPRFLYVGTLSKRKGLGDLVSALRILGSDFARRWNFVVVGGSAEVGEEEADEIRHAVEAAGYSDSLVGSLPQSGVRDQLERADVFVLPSHWEGQPIAILEAMASGLPVLSTRVGAIPDVVREGVDGLLVEPHDPAALAEGIRRLAGDADLRRQLGASARRRAEASFDTSNLRSRMTEIYRRAIESRR